MALANQVCKSCKDKYNLVTSNDITKRYKNACCGFCGKQIKLSKQQSAVSKDE